MDWRHCKEYLDESRSVTGLQPTIAYDLLLGRTSSELPCSIVIFDRVDDGISATAPADMRHVGPQCLAMDTVMALLIPSCSLREYQDTLHCKTFLGGSSTSRKF